MLSINDKEYAEAIRCYLRNTFLKDLSPDSEISIDFNAAKPLCKYIKSLSSDPENFKFSTPLYVWWDLTSACNFRCVHCLYNDSEYSSKNDLTTDEALNLANELINDFGIASVALSGGEIFLRKDTMDIIRYFKKNNISVHLATNAFLLNDKKIDELAEMFDPYSDAIQVSLDGATKETYEKIRQTNTFEKVVNNIKKLTKKNITVNISYTINKINYNEFLDAYKLCSDIGVNSLLGGRLMCFNKTHEALKVPDRELMILNSKAYQMDISKYKTDLRCNLFSIINLLNMPYVIEILKEDEFQDIFKKYTIPLSRDCNSHEKLCIRSDGKVYMCMQADRCKDSLLGNYKERSLIEIWKDREMNILFKPRLMKNSKCNNCKYNVLCFGGCKAVSYEKFGNIDFPEINCKNAKY